MLRFLVDLLNRWQTKTDTPSACSVLAGLIFGYAQ